MIRVLWRLWRRFMTAPIDASGYPDMRRVQR